MAAPGGLTAAGYVRDYVPVGLALTTTALGTLLPILRDNDMPDSQFGRYIFAASVAGELFPILIIAVCPPLASRTGSCFRLCSVFRDGNEVPGVARASSYDHFE